MKMRAKQQKSNPARWIIIIIIINILYGAHLSINLQRLRFMRCAIVYSHGIVCLTPTKHHIYIINIVHVYITYSMVWLSFTRWKCPHNIFYSINALSFVNFISCNSMRVCMNTMRHWLPMEIACICVCLSALLSECISLFVWLFFFLFFFIYLSCSFGWFISNFNGIFYILYTQRERESTIHKYIISF